MRIKTIISYYFTAVRMAIMKRLQITSSDEERKKLLNITSENINWYMEKSMKVLQKIRSRITTFFSSLIARYISKENEISMSKRQLHSHV